MKHLPRPDSSRSPKLALRRETVRILTDFDLKLIAAGEGNTDTTDTDTMTETNDCPPGRVSPC